MIHHLDTQVVNARLLDAAARLDALQLVDEIDEATWGLAFGGVTDCLLELEEGGTGLTLTVDLGAPIEARKAHACSTALAYNALWRETHGMRIAQVGPEGELLLVLQLSADEVRSYDFPAVLESFKHAAVLWTAFLQLTGSVDVASEGLPFNSTRI